MTIFFSQRTKKRLCGDSGQSLIEFALALPLLLFLILGLFDFGRGIFYWLDATHVANEGARLAAVAGPSQTSCSGLATYIQQRTSGQLQSGNGSASGVQSPSTVSISFPSNTGPGGAPQIGDPVTVTVNATFKYVPAGYIPGTMPIHAAATMRLEQVPGFTTGC
ncbi:MAG TPA: TadE/TadG family type IV pilus assembly protein [Chloroflexota bacterium]